ncbi:MAG: hypothetical protein AAGF10_03185 [Verrucomicrobiota bacterium]
MSARGSLYLVFIGMLTLGAISQGSAATDDFSAAEIDSRNWEPSFKLGTAKLAPVDGVLNFTTTGEPSKAFRYLYMRAQRFYFGKDWSVEVEAGNDVLPMRSGQLGSIGIEVYNAKNLERRVSMALSVSRITGMYSRVAYTQAVSDGETVASRFSEPLPEKALLQMSWDSGAKVLTVAYKDPEIDTKDDPWQVLGTYGFDGGEGDISDLVWRMGRRGQFLVYLYGYSEELEVTPGEMTLDNFSATVD